MNSSFYMNGEKTMVRVTRKNLLMVTTALMLIPVGGTAQAGPEKPKGFVIAVDGKPVAGEDALVRNWRRNKKLSFGRITPKNFSLKFDGLNVDPRLHVKLLSIDGNTASFKSELNYPSWIERGEIRLIATDEHGISKVVSVVPIDANGTVQVQLPQVETLEFVHRVYDAKGRFDETRRQPVTERDIDASDVEEGTDTIAKRGIPVRGGSITLSGQNLAPGQRVTALGEQTVSDPSGRFVLQRIVPVGTHLVPVQSGGLSFSRQVTVPKSEWFYTAIADLTLGYRDTSFPGRETGTYNRGRLAFYAKGRTAAGYDITASADTGEDALSELWRNFDKKDPRNLLLRVNPEDLYPVYGDDSTLVDNTPTSGKFYLRVEKNNSYFVWGDFKNEVTGGEYNRNTVTRYGAQLVYRTPSQTSHGAPRVEAELFGAQPDRLTQLDVFDGTGGSTFFLRRQDVSAGTESITVETRDPISDRVTDRVILEQGRDYEINYIQGVIILRRPLSSLAANANLVTDAATGDGVHKLVVNYAYTPTTGNIDGLTYGARANTWLSDKIRFGVAGTHDEYGVTSHSLVSGNLLYRHSDNSFAELEYARSTGAPISFATSSDGGLTINSTAPANASGDALRLKFHVDLDDLPTQATGAFGAYYERRSAGFSNMDITVAADERFAGFYGDFDITEKSAFRIYGDLYSNTTGARSDEIGVEYKHRVNEQLDYVLALEDTRRVTPGTPATTGSRLDVAARVNYSPSDRLTWHLGAQATVKQSGGLSKNNRATIGLDYALSDALTFSGEVSQGTSGTGARALLTYDKGEAGNIYVGYTLDPMRAFSASTPTGSDKGVITVGARRKVSDELSVFTENSYDVFGQRKTLATQYGVEYTPSDNMSYIAQIEHGDLNEATRKTRRTAVTLGLKYQDDGGLSASGRLELRRDDTEIGGVATRADTLLLNASTSWKISEEQRLMFSLSGAHTRNSDVTVEDGHFLRLDAGYAFRPINNDRLNVLAKYSYVYDTFGQMIDGSSNAGPKQRSHVFGLDASYDLNKKWTVGGKVAYRFGESAPVGTTTFSSSDAFLGLVNLRYHFVHNWDALAELRHLRSKSAQTGELGGLVAIYRHLNGNLKLGVGYNFSNFSDDLTDLTYEDHGIFVNLIAKF